MELISKEMPADYEIYDTGDLHIGVANCNEEAIVEMVDDIASKPDRYIILKGDLIDSIPLSDKRFAVTSFKGRRVTTPQDQSNRAMEILKPIKDRILFIQLGNHEYKLINTVDFVGDWCKAFNVPWGGIMAKFIHLSAGKPQWKGLFCHGNGSINTVAKDPIQGLANMKALLKRKLQYLAGDTIVMSMGHTHKLLRCKPTIQNQLTMTDDGEKLLQSYRVDTDQSASYIDVEARWYVNTGSFLKTMSDPGEGLIPYSEVAMYGPIEQGYCKIIVKDHKVCTVERVTV